jgi:hypothetical protein
MYYSVCVKLYDVNNEFVFFWLLSLTSEIGYIDVTTN